MEMNGIILGAGIAGLSTAIALRQRNISVKIFEAAKEIQPVGAGILIPPNAMAILERYGLSNLITNAGKTIESMKLVDIKGRLLTHSPAHFSNNGIPNSTIAIHRATLQKILLDAIEPETLFTSKTCRTLNNHPDKVELCFEDQTTATGNFLIAADGIHSNTRRTLFPTSSLHYSGQICWRGITTITLPYQMQTQLTEVWGLGQRFGFVPINNEQVYWYATITDTDQGVKNNTATKDNSDSSRQQLSNLYKNFPDPVQEIIHTTRPQSIRCDKLYDLNILNQWHSGACVLIGDAAHATTPNLGQGGAQAIEDSWVLAEKITESKTLEQAFTDFQNLRIARAKKIVELSRQIGRISNLSNPVACAIRNTCMRWTPSNLTNKQSQQLYKLPY
ncbi:hypothetical protein GCM10011613_08960 [Cellvibrio zantedeschiae]|uniref:FAD-binding domain-containing protein n=1 Tax=Cellvibrio zantedeschiae TaxID=1237077 RepID=A0ABQ3ATW2_9GAMM|nr:FAD-dependent monooxygenase [Cellvibrio zantedeschiae]GGY67088.1 hypothetical protein GCM10011613_08960 [Cellvibrio zantedeschiae]